MDQPIKLDLLPGLRSLSAAADRDDASEESKFDDVKALQEELVTVTFVLPDDSTVSQQFKKGHTVAVLKAFLSDECDLDVHSTVLSLDGQLMLDPFSLTDFAPVVGASAIEVMVRHGNDHSRK